MRTALELHPHLKRSSCDVRDARRCQATGSEGSTVVVFRKGDGGSAPFHSPSPIVLDWDYSQMGLDRRKRFLFFSDVFQASLMQEWGSE